MLKSCKILNKKFHNVEFEERVISVNRVVKVVKGGRIFSFSTIVVIGNKNGYFGIGMGKSRDVSEARKKAINNAKKNLHYAVITKDKTIPHEVTAKFCSSKIIVRPAKSGTGIIAGGAARAVLECIGYKDVVAKCIGSTNPYNLSSVVFEALMKLRSAKYFSKTKSKDCDLCVNED